ncbi:Uma2 family endonuclease [Actinomadura darangshiensis]|uniref:Uma2 family endonuclease n=1 Tax=Actinomadura darangshiensis TaxID=705336 RepID=A0A4R5BRG7_9ACTN|nr:Uma2 family endonuclease [Actinomadura darangshiensis]TDD88136.1 Uma2 family endonuclease [Actinomadura darangshiensis]
MTAMVQEPLSHGNADVVLEGFLALDTPQGFRAELIDGEIVVTPPPLGDHERCIAKIIRQVIRYTATEFECACNKGLKLPGADGQPDNHVIPDITFISPEADPFHRAASWMPVAGDGIVMVVEVTSTRPGQDREAKRTGYARAGIPYYLLVDRDEERVVLFSGPDGKDYGHTDQVPIGKTLPLPEPFGIELDTAAFA